MRGRENRRVVGRDDQMGKDENKGGKKGRRRARSRKE